MCSANRCSNSTCASPACWIFNSSEASKADTAYPSTSARTCRMPILAALLGVDLSYMFRTHELLKQAKCALFSSFVFPSVPCDCSSAHAALRAPANSSDFYTSSAYAAIPGSTGALPVDGSFSQFLPRQSSSGILVLQMFPPPCARQFHSGWTSIVLDIRSQFHRSLSPLRMPPHYVRLSFLDTPPSPLPRFSGCSPGCSARISAYAVSH